MSNQRSSRVLLFINCHFLVRHSVLKEIHKIVLLLHVKHVKHVSLCGLLIQILYNAPGACGDVDLRFS